MMDFVPLVFLALLLVLATVFDLRQRRIPNAVTMPVMASALIYFIYVNGLTPSAQDPECRDDACNGLGADLLHIC